MSPQDIERKSNYKGPEDITLIISKSKGCPQRHTK